jgi:multidrug efflux pump subunit AcrB
MENNNKREFIKEHIERTRRGPFGFFISRFRVVVLIILGILLLGVISLMELPREADPEVKIPIAVVNTIYPGASPSDVEELITDEVEASLEEIDNVKRITSSSKTSISTVVIEFEAEADLDESIRELKDKVSEIRGLPQEAENPVATQVRANDFPVITFSLAGNITETELKQLGEIVQDNLESISGVSKAPLLGSRIREFSVVVDSGLLERFNISLGQIIGSIGGSNMDAPLGNITIAGVDYNLRTVSKFSSIDDLRKVVVSNVNGANILLEDIAKIEDEFADQESISRISIDGRQAVNSVSLQIYKKTGGNILEIVQSAKDKLEELKSQGVIPASVYINTSNDYSSFIKNDLNTLGTSGVQATFFIFLIMLIALSYREAIISFISIPLTFLITFIFLNIFGYTINSLSLFALVLSLGLLVDTFIVILEGIFHNIKAGYNSTEAALLSVAHYKKPLTAGILTTISAFVPMLLVSGILGEYLKVLPITISITLFSSLFVSFIIVPSLSGFLLRKSKFTAEGKDSILERYLTNKLQRVYKRNICKFLGKRKFKVIFSLVFGGLFIGALSLLFTGIISIQLFPKIDVDFAYINLKMPVGTDIKETEKVVNQIEDILYDNLDLESFVTTIGQSYSFDFISGGGGNNLASINLNFIDKDKRNKKSYEITEELRGKLGQINKGEVVVTEISAGPPTGSPIEVRVMGEDLAVLDGLISRIVDNLKNTEGVINIENSKEVSPADLVFEVKKDVLLKYGLTVGDIAGTLRTAIFGSTATDISIEGDDVDVVVRIDKEKISSTEDLKNLAIKSRLGGSVKLSQVVDFSLDPAPSTIRHRDLKRALTVSAELKPGFTPAEIVPMIEEIIKKEGIPEGYIMEFGGEVEDIEQSFSELWNAMIVALLLILIILVLQFDSFVIPFAILLPLPFTLIGVVFGMLILGLDFSFSVFLGLVSLSGIVVNDAIVLVDKTKRNVREMGMTPREAVASAGESRLQPILLTSITTIIGVIPLAMADEFWLGLSIAIIFGLSFATILQLFMIPMLFLKFEGKAILKKVK